MNVLAQEGPPFILVEEVTPTPPQRGNKPPRWLKWALMFVVIIAVAVVIIIVMFYQPTKGVVAEVVESSTITTTTPSTVAPQSTADEESPNVILLSEPMPVAEAFVATTEEAPCSLDNRWMRWGEKEFAPAGYLTEVYIEDIDRSYTILHGKLLAIGTRTVAIPEQATVEYTELTFCFGKNESTDEPIIGSILLDKDISLYSMLNSVHLDDPNPQFHLVGNQGSEGYDVVPVDVIVTLLEIGEWYPVAIHSYILTGPAVCELVYEKVKENLDMTRDEALEMCAAAHVTYDYFRPGNQGFIDAIKHGESPEDYGAVVNNVGVRLEERYVPTEEA